MVANSARDTTFLSALLAARGLSIDGLARRLRERSGDRTQPDSSLVWKWVNARTRPSRHYLEILAAELNVSPQSLKSQLESDYQQHTERPGGQRNASDPPDVSSEVRFPPEELIDRRVVIQALLLSSGAGALAELHDAVDRNTLSRAAAEGLAIATDHLGRNFDHYDLVELQAQLDFHMGFVGRHLRESLTVNQRTMLCSHGAQLAGMAASVAFMTGNVHGATVYDDISFRLAREISDARIMAWLLCEEAGMATYADDPARAIALLDRAGGTTDRAQRANAASNAARAYAQVGNHAKVAEFVELAEGLSLGIVAEEDSSIAGPHWSFSQISAFTRIAESWLEIDRPSQAMSAAEHALQVSGINGNPRLVAHARLIQCAAQVSLGNVDVACEAASEVFALTPQDFNTIAAHAKPLFQRLRAMSSSAHVVQLKSEYEHYLRRAPV
jgi:transcriptional regulator with XRE-family HTH domain